MKKISRELHPRQPRHPQEPTRYASLKDRHCWFLFLPPYSPDLNPIEMAFPKLKAHLKRIGARTFNVLLKAIGDICGLFDQEECLNFLRHAGYLKRKDKPIY